MNNYEKWEVEKLVIHLQNEWIKSGGAKNTTLKQRLQKDKEFRQQAKEEIAIKHQPLAKETTELANWVCSHCGRINPSTEFECRGCGSR